MKKTLLWVLAVSLVLPFTSCKKSLSDADSADLGAQAAPEGFDYSTTKNVELNVRLLTVTEQPLANVLVNIYNPSELVEGAELTKAISDKDGFIRTTLTVPASLQNVVIDPAFTGLSRNVEIYFSGTSASAIIGGRNGVSGNIVANKAAASSSTSFSMKGASTLAGTTVVDYDKNKFDNLGRPLDILPTDPFDWVQLLHELNTSLPERIKVKNEYIKSEVPSNLEITSLADVWITFVHEGADYRNSLGYYTYPTGSAPASQADIDTIHMVFPNASLKGAKGEGNMIQGDKVKIGRFKAGTTIGFVLFQNAFTGNKNVDVSRTKFFTNEAFNPEKDLALKRHNVLLNNIKNRIFLIGFEDINREQSGDQDFNDLVFYAQSNPVEAISPIGIPYTEEKVIDTDKDGVPDLNDEYPEDKDRAYNRYYPSKNIWGTTAFEDLWPAEGDYDLNDLVLNYRYKFAMSPVNKVVDLTGEYKTLAAGASYANGFGVQLPLSQNLIQSVSGYKLAENYIKLNPNGTEQGQDKAVIIPFDNFRSLFGGASTFINTERGKPKVASERVEVSILFTTPLDESFTASAPFNPFMISDLKREREVHLVNHAPTSLADQKLLKTGADVSDPALGKYYLTKDNRPFALDIYGSFEYPVERKAIYDAYLHFGEWAKSGGALFSDWYYNVSDSKYRNSANIYK